MNSKGAFWGTVLILLGVFILLKQTGFLFFHIDWLLWRKLWPLFIILIGIRLILPKENKLIGLVLILLVIGIFSFSVYEGIRYKKAMENGSSLGGGNYNLIPPSNPKDEDPSDSLNDSHSDGDPIMQKFNVPLSTEIKTAHLELQGGAALFSSDFTHSNLFEATTQIDRSESYRLERSSNGQNESIKLVSENPNHNLSLNNKDNANQVKIRLNPDILWNIDLDIGAGKVDYDFSGYKIQNLNLNSGLNAVDLKLGRLNPMTHLNVDASLASFHLLVPQSSGCKIHMDGALSSKEFNGFKKIDDENYKTDNYNSADKKIDIQITGGISEISINQY